MSNMSYCRFQNTVKDLEDCWYNLDKPRDDDEDKAFKRMIKLCCDIAIDYGHKIGRTIEEVE